MSTLAGWLDSPIGDAPADLILKTMVEARAFGRGELRFTHAGTAGIAVRSSPPEGSLAAGDALSAAIVGRPRWTHPELAALAARAGHASALSEAYRRHREELFQHLRGSFAFVVVDREARRALLAVDRFGIHTSCYSQPESGGLIFGSSADVVRAHPAARSTVSEQAIFNYLFFGICPSPGTIYREQFKLLPAQYLIYERGAIRTSFYWCMLYREVTSKSVPALAKELMETLRMAVARATAEQDPATLGAFLSGGLDSSTVAGLLSEATGRRAKTFTIGFSHDKYDEVHFAEIAARHFGTEQYTYYLRPSDVVSSLTIVARGFDEPFGNSSVVPAYYCAKLAREHGVRLMLAGDGGDEIFAGNSRYVDQQILGLYSTIPSALRKHLIEPILFGLPGLDNWTPGRRARGYVRKANTPMPGRLEAHNFYGNAVPSNVFTADALAMIDTQEPLANLREAYERTASSSMLQRMLHLDLKITLADNDLRKVGGACEMAGLAVAYPFLDDDVVEFSAQVPPSLLIRRFNRRWLFRHAVCSFLPAETLAKPKHGFGMPYMEWPREDSELKALSVDCVRGFKQRGYLRPDFLDRVIAHDEAGTYDSLVWDIVMLELWFHERESTAHAARPAGKSVE